MKNSNTNLETVGGKPMSDVELAHINPNHEFISELRELVSTKVASYDPSDEVKAYEFGT